MDRRSFLVGGASIIAWAGIAKHAYAQVFRGRVPDAPFQPYWESLKAYRCPDWYRDAKLGIWAHWSPQCVPEQGDWYARNMYVQGSRQYQYHVKTYGHPSQFGYKDSSTSARARSISSRWPPTTITSIAGIQNISPGTVST